MENSMDIVKKVTVNNLLSNYSTITILYENKSIEIFDYKILELPNDFKPALLLNKTAKEIRNIFNK